MTRTPPTVLVGGVHATSREIVSALRTEPVLLVVVLLNATMCVSAAWFLLTQEGYRHTERLELGEMLKSCIDKERR
jgi:hypothetical protein